MSKSKNTGGGVLRVSKNAMPSLSTLRSKKEENKAFSKIKQSMRLGIKGMIKKGRDQAKKARESIEDFKRDEDASIETKEETNRYGFPFG